jgi:hypothetical protein
VNDEENQLEVYTVVLDFFFEEYLIDIIHNHQHKYVNLYEYNEYVLHYLEDKMFFLIISLKLYSFLIVF